ncbi:NAD(+) diphosphatase [Actinomyces bowdenii]|uniref:NAD(+) diphosphatase n=1 Tax=Actinomyces bowdenii TaxID=131109 RepID=UPI001FBB7C6C|nr:NAD(+) diphosphatase [Actinomyces bowdenii]
MMTDWLPLSRSRHGRDAERRSRPGLVAGLSRDPSTRLVIIDARGRVALRRIDSPARSAGPTPPAAPAGAGGTGDGDGAARRVPTEEDSPGWEPPAARASSGGPEGRRAPTPQEDRLPRITAADLDPQELEGLTTIYLGRTGRAEQEGRPRGGTPSEGTGQGSAAPQAAVEATGAQGSEGTSWLAVVVPAELEVPEAPAAPAGGRDAEGAGTRRPGLRRLLERYPLIPLRTVGAQMSARDAGLTTAAAALAAWHASSTYCPGCAGATRPVDAGWARRCTVCSTTHFPRTDPAVIVAATDEDDRLVMVHGATWPQGRYSVVAGYVEAGEPLEAAVVREVAEETGLEVSRVEYVASQPWPFPRSLMVGYRARLVPGGQRPRPDGEEVTEVLLVSRGELGAAVSRGSIILPGATSIGRALIEDWYGGPIPG